MHLYDNMTYTQCVSSSVALFFLDKFKSKWLNLYEHFPSLFSGILPYEHNNKKNCANRVSTCYIVSEVALENYIWKIKAYLLNL